MVSYNISSDYNQKMTITVRDVKYHITLRSFRGMLYCTIIDDDDKILAANIRCINDHWLIPLKNRYRGGNLRFEGLKDHYIHPVDFEKIKLVYYDSDEMVEVE